MNPKYRLADFFELKSDITLKMEIQDIVYEAVTIYKKTGKTEYSGFEGYLVYFFDGKDILFMKEEEITEKYTFLRNSFDS